MVILSRFLLSIDIFSPYSVILSADYILSMLLYGKSFLLMLAKLFTQFRHFFLTRRYNDGGNNQSLILFMEEML